MSRFRVDLDKSELVFSAAHFITYRGDQCECLHGHNYRVRASVEGPLDDNGYVIDFIALRDRLASIIRPLDHQVLLPTRHPLIRLRERPGEVLVSFGDRNWMFPRQDCVLLPVANTTAELLARHIGRRLRNAVDREPEADRWTLAVGVDENGGQWGWWNERRDG
ncbi:MAG: 6-pyruvoyl tetrahydropterin synthase family protein [Planctomycetes bacterium]|nr:6-pyruvoyl tetrahydropterin synthase family protein [Planctomycetota bacterium]